MDQEQEEMTTTTGATTPVSTDPEMDAMVRIQEILSRLSDEKEPDTFQSQRQRVIWYFTQKEGLVARRGRKPNWQTPGEHE